MVNRIQNFNNVLYTEVLAQGTNLNKTIVLEDGEVKKTSNAHMSMGEFSVKNFSNLRQLDTSLNNLDSNQAIILGRPKLSALREGHFVPKGESYPEGGTISRTNQDMTECIFSACLFDIDIDEQMPESMKDLHSPDALRSKILQLMPELTNVQMMIRASSSSSVFNTTTNKHVFEDNNSYHIYFVIANCTKGNLKNFIEWLKRKSVQSKLAYVKVHKDGSTGFRTLVDLAPLQSLCSRLVFEAKPTVVKPLAIKETPTSFYNLETNCALDLSQFNPNELPDYRPWYESQKQLLKPTSNSIRNSFKNQKLETLMSQGIEKSFANKMVKDLLDTKTISCYDYMYKSDGTLQTILIWLTTNPDGYFNDIVEPQKKDKCYIKTRDMFNASIYSFCRGGVEYKISFDFNAIIYLIKFLSSSSFRFYNCVLALENLLMEDTLSVEEVYETKKILEEEGLLGLNNSFLENVFKGILEKKALKMMEKYAVLLSNGSFSIIDMTKNSLTPYKIHDMKSFYKNKKLRGYDVESQKFKSYNPVDIWMESSKRREFTDITFDPSMQCDEKTYNQFRGFKYQPQNMIDISLYHDLLKNVICSGDQFMYGIVWSFFAQLIQEPENKIGVALILLSKMGTGKGTAIQPIVELLDGYSLVTADSNTLFGRFANNSDCLLCYYNEAAELNYNKSLISKFKHCVTEKITTVEIKNGPIYSTPSCIRLILDSNEDKLLHETADSRRTWYLPISESRIGDKKYFQELYSLYETEGFYETLMFQLTTFDLTQWKPLLKNPIRNEVLIEQQLQSLNEITSWWLTCLQEGEIIDAYYELTTHGLKISNRELYNSYTSFTRKSGKKVYDEQVAFGKMMKKHCVSDVQIVTSNAKDKKGDNAKVYTHLSDCIAYFLKKQKLDGIEMPSTQWCPSKRANETILIKV